MKKTIWFKVLSLTLIFNFQISFAQNGNVGIGTNDPQSKLHVAGDMQVDDKTDFKNGNGQTVFRIDPNDGNLKMFNDAGDQVMVFKLTEAVSLTGETGGPESSSGFGIDFATMELELDELDTKVEPGSVEVSENDNSATVFPDGIQFKTDGDDFFIFANPEDNKLIIDAELCVKKITAEEGSDQTTLDECGYLNEKDDIGTSLSTSGLFQFDATNSIGFFYDLFGGNINALNDLFVSGELNAFTKLFRIDHPLDPYNKILQHISVESPDMMNIYNGNIITDNNGNATVQLPEYFEALNMDFRYQLTVIGSFAQAIISKKVENNQFEIRSNEPNVEVSWQVTGIRNDTFAQERRIQVEVPKKGDEIGKLLFEPGKKREMPAEVRELIKKRKAQMAASKSGK